MTTVKLRDYCTGSCLTDLFYKSGLLLSFDSFSKYKRFCLSSKSSSLFIPALPRRVVSLAVRPVSRFLQLWTIPKDEDKVSAEIKGRDGCDLTLVI